MKKTIAILLSVSCLFGLNSCFKTEDDIFSESAAQRLDTLESTYRELLSSSENGWVLQYFASESEQGYPFVMQFDKTGSVTIAGNNSESTSGSYKEETSTYDFVQDMSVVLTFDTYNTIFHEFSQPSTDGVGHGGDYEFQIKGVSADQDTIYLVGKKTAIEMRMVRFPMGATYTDTKGVQKTVESWSGYFTAIKEATSALFNTKLPTYTLNGPVQNYEVSGMGSGVMNFVPEGLTETEASSRTYTRGIIVNLDNSIRLSSPFTGEENEFKFQTMKLSADGSKMEAVDGTKDVTLSLPVLGKLFVGNSLTWSLSKANCQGQFATLVQNLADGLLKYSKKAKFTSLIFGYDTKQACHYLSIKTSGFTGKLYGEFTTVDDTTVKFTFNGNGDNNGKAFLQNVAAVQPLLDFLQSTNFNLSATSSFAPTTMSLTSAANSADTALLSL